MSQDERIGKFFRQYDQLLA